MRVWDAVRRIIRESGKTQRQVSRIMCKSDNYVGACATAGRSPSVDTLLRILRAVDADYELQIVRGEERITIE